MPWVLQFMGLSAPTDQWSRGEFWEDLAPQFCPPTNVASETRRARRQFGVILGIERRFAESHRENALRISSSTWRFDMCFAILFVS